MACASDAFPAWSGATPAERSAALTRLAAVLEDRAAEYALVETRQTGKPIRLTTEFDVPGSIDNVSFFAGAARHLEGKASAEWDGVHTSLIRREPVGVVGSIAPWNYPLQMAMWKILPAIAGGQHDRAQARRDHAAHLPHAGRGLHRRRHPGRRGQRRRRGRAPRRARRWSATRGVAMVSFTGSTAVGKRVMELATASVKRVHLELGGKAPFVVFDDADLEAAVHGAVAASLINSGQDCTAATRAYVQRPLFDAFVAGVADLYRRRSASGDPRTRPPTSGR